jgi:hypothetical protein
MRREFFLQPDSSARPPRRQPIRNFARDLDLAVRTADGIVRSCECAASAAKGLDSFGTIDNALLDTYIADGSVTLRTLPRDS